MITIATILPAAEKAPFYQGKTINVVINFAAGGPTDIESRVFAKHLSKHISGNPTITVQAMGGGGLTAVNYIGEVAKPDGFTAAYFTGSLFQRREAVGERQQSDSLAAISRLKTSTRFWVGAQHAASSVRKIDASPSHRFAPAGARQ